MIQKLLLAISLSNYWITKYTCMLFRTFRSQAELTKNYFYLSYLYIFCEILRDIKPSNSHGSKNYTSGYILKNQGLLQNEKGYYSA